jgi:hypothetical protein
MKYWSTVRPSRKFAVMGVSMISPEGLAMRPRMAASWRICCFEPRAPGVGHDVDRVEDGSLDLARLGSVTSPCRPSIISFGDLVGDAGPDVDDLVVALAVGDQALLVLVDDLLDLGPARRRCSTFFFGGITMLSMQIETPALGRVLVAERAQRSARSTVSLLRCAR